MEVTHGVSGGQHRGGDRLVADDAVLRPGVVPVADAAFVIVAAEVVGEPVVGPVGDTARVVLEPPLGLEVEALGHFTAGYVFAPQRLLEPVQVERLDVAAEPYDRGQVPLAVAVDGEPPRAGADSPDASRNTTNSESNHRT